MGCAVSKPPVEVSLFAKDFYITAPDTWMYEPLTEWMNAFGMNTFRAAVLSQLDKNLTSFEYKMAYQTAATRTDEPDAFSPLGDSPTIGAASLCTEKVLSYTGKAWFRIAIAYRTRSTSLSGMSRVRASLSWIQCGSIAGAHEFTATTTSSTSTMPGAANEPVTEWMPAWYADRVQFAIIPTDVQGNITLMPTYQTAETSPEVADDWQFLPAATASPSERNTGELSPTLTGKMWVRFGLGYYLTSGASLGQAVVNVATAVRHV